MHEALGHLHAGRAAQALQCCSAILKQFPQAPDALNIAAIAAYQTGQLDKALKLLKKALKLKPDWADARANLGLVFLDLEKPALAVQELRHAIRLNPGHANAHADLALALNFEGRLIEAEKAARQAVELAPDKAKAWNTLGIVLQSRDAVDDAEQAFREAIRLAPAHVHACVNLAGLLESVNRAHDIADVYSDAAKLGIRDPRLDVYMAKALRREKRYAEARALLAPLTDATLAAPVMQMAHNELGMLANAEDDPATAMACFQRSNDIARTQIATGARTDYALKEARVMRRFVEEHALTAPAPLEGVKTPVFLVGFPRSGTTLLDQILSGHPNLVTIEEKPIAAELLHRVEAMGPGFPDALIDMDDDTRRTLAQLYWEKAAEVATWQDGDLVIDKLPLNARLVPLLWTVFPRAKFIIALRHPADACLSCFMQNFKLNDAMANFLTIDDTVALYEAVMDAWLAARQALPIAAHSVRYEDVVDDLEGEARKLLGFLDQEWDDGVLDYRASAEAKKAIHTPSYHQVVQPIYRHARFRWTRYAEHIGAPALKRLAPFAEAFGYDMDAG